ncbi:MAG: J domain-containing protein [Lachnospiraceae bacterium]|nr:J domain-containing protein [Lachnospiraceae bacterium]
MIANPYEVLGISPSATDDEVKRAYRELSRKYHPDSYVNNPLSDLAEEKFKEVQEAYDQIMKQRENGGYQGGFSGQQSGGYSHSSNSGDATVQMQAAANYINARHYREALNVLNNISNRNAQWYYYSAAANYGMGNNIVAMQHAQQAAAMEPNNPEYANMVNRMQWQGQRYQNTGYGYGRQSYGTGNMCCDLWCADTLCECMGGDLCTCM